MNGLGGSACFVFPLFFFVQRLHFFVFLFLSRAVERLSGWGKKGWQRFFLFFLFCFVQRLALRYPYSEMVFSAH